MIEKKPRRTLRDVAPLFLSPADRSQPEGRRPPPGSTARSRAVAVYSASSEHSSDWTTALLANLLALQGAKPVILLGTPAYGLELIPSSAGGPAPPQSPASADLLKRSLAPASGLVLVSLSESGYLPNPSDFSLFHLMLVTCSPDGASCERAYRFSKWAQPWAPWLAHVLLLDQVEAQDLFGILRTSMEAIYRTFLTWPVQVLGSIPPARKHQVLSDLAWLESAAAPRLDLTPLRGGEEAPR